MISTMMTMISTMKWTKQTPAAIRRAIATGSISPAARTTVAEMVQCRMTHHATPHRERVRMAEILWMMATAGWVKPIRSGHGVMELMTAIMHEPNPPATALATVRFIFRVERDLVSTVRKLARHRRIDSRN